MPIAPTAMAAANIRRRFGFMTLVVTTMSARPNSDRLSIRRFQVRAVVGVPTSVRGRSGSEAGYFSGIGVARSTGTAVTLFCGEPSITRSE